MDPLAPLSSPEDLAEARRISAVAVELKPSVTLQCSVPRPASSWYLTAQALATSWTPGYEMIPVSDSNPDHEVMLCVSIISHILAWMLHNSRRRNQTRYQWPIQYQHSTPACYHLFLLSAPSGKSQIWIKWKMEVGMGSHYMLFV